MPLENTPSPVETHEGPPSPLLTYLREHGYDNLETLNLTLVLTEHISEKNAASIVARIPACDIFIPESAQVTPNVVARYNAIANGTLSVEDSKLRATAGMERFSDAILKGLEGSGKAVEVADVPEGGDAKEKDEVARKLEFFVEEVIERKWSRIAARNLMLARYTKLLDSTAERERHMIQEIGPAIVRAMREHTKQAKTLNVLMYLGAGHEPIVPLLQALHSSVEIAKEHNTEAEGYHEDLQHLVARGKPVSDELADAALTYVLLGRALKDQLPKIFKTLPDAIRFLRYATDVLTDEEREEIHGIFLQGNEVNAAREVAQLLDKKKVLADFKQLPR